MIGTSEVSVHQSAGVGWRSKECLRPELSTTRSGYDIWGGTNGTNGDQWGKLGWTNETRLAWHIAGFSVIDGKLLSIWFTARFCCCCCCCWWVKDGWKGVAARLKWKLYNKLHTISVNSWIEIWLIHLYLTQVLVKVLVKIKVTKTYTWE